jgi:hypothetical protein
MPVRNSTRSKVAPSPLSRQRASPPARSPPDEGTWRADDRRCDRYTTSTIWSSTFAAAKPRADGVAEDQKRASVSSRIPSACCTHEGFRCGTPNTRPRHTA